MLSFSITIFTYWLIYLLFCSGDVHPNPGPLTPTSPSIFPKLEVIHTELFDFDILTFSETWLSDSIDTDDLLLESFNKPERKDRPGDKHGGVMLYVKEGIYYKRRNDLELQNIESIW